VIRKPTATSRCTARMWPYQNQIPAAAQKIAVHITLRYTIV
jgi:hypothetical protein